MVIDYDQLLRVLVEHQQYEEANRSPTRMRVLRTIEYAPKYGNTEVITIDQIKDELEDERTSSSPTARSIRTCGR